jgi:hypothetical protein
LPHDVKKNQILFLTWNPLIHKIAFSFFLGVLAALLDMCCIFVS